MPRGRVSAAVAEPAEPLQNIRVAMPRCATFLIATILVGLACESESDDNANATLADDDDGATTEQPQDESPYVPCSADGQCGDGLTCHLVLHTCTAPCEMDADCEPAPDDAQRCHPEIRSCAAGCLGDDDCVGGTRCDPNYRVCYAP